MLADIMARIHDTVNNGDTLQVPPEVGSEAQDKEEASVEEGSQLWLTKAVCLGGVGNHRCIRMALSM